MSGRMSFDKDLILQATLKLASTGSVYRQYAVYKQWAAPTSSSSSSDCEGLSKAGRDKGSATVCSLSLRYSTLKLYLSTFSLIRSRRRFSISAIGYADKYCKGWWLDITRKNSR